MTNDDKLRVMGILFFEDIRDNIPFVMGLRDYSKNHNKRMHLYSWNGKKRSTLNTIHQWSIDSKVVVLLPEKWKEHIIKEKVDEALGAGTYDSTKFNPNNRQRIKLPWEVKHVKAIILIVISEYNKIMYLYTKGTGGGNGDPTSYCIWQEREDVHFLHYSKTENFLYLTIAHMWDKKYQFPLTVIKDTLPSNVAIDDNMNNDNDDKTLSIRKNTNSRPKNVAKKSIDNAIAKAIKQTYHE